MGTVVRQDSENWRLAWETGHSLELPVLSDARLFSAEMLVLKPLFPSF